MAHSAGNDPEEYTDANRRLSVGLLLMSVPLPGSLHFYAGERRAGWKHVGAAALPGLSSIIAGAALIDEKDSWEKSDFETADIVGQSGKVTRYEKVPVGEENGAMVYRYNKLGRKEGRRRRRFDRIGCRPARWTVYTRFSWRNKDH